MLAALCCYLNGQGVDQDEEYAVELFRAAEEGDCGALFAQCYNTRIGVDTRCFVALFKLGAPGGKIFGFPISSGTYRNSSNPGHLLGREVFFNFVP